MDAEHRPMDPTATLADSLTAKARRLVQRRAWILGALALALAAFAYRRLLAFRPTDSIVVEVEGWFFEPSDTAPLIVVALSLWLLYRRSARLAALTWQGGSVVLSAVLYTGSLAVFCWSLLTEASDLQAISLILASLATANLLGGRPALRVVWLPVCFLLFAIPIPSPLRHEIVWALQNWTAEATGLLLYTLGIPAVVSGDRILLANTVFAVIETCSGLRSVITLLMLAVLMIDLFRRRGLHAALLLIFTPFLAFATNALRSLTLVLNPASNIASIHSLQGIAMLLASVFVLYSFDGLLERLHVPNGGRPRTKRAAGPTSLSRTRLACAFGVLALLGVLSSAVRPWREPLPTVRLPIDVLPRHLGDWRAMDLETDRLFLGMAAMAGAVDRRYAHGGERVDVFVAAGSPHQRLRSFYSPKTALPGSGWIIESATRVERSGRMVDELVVRRGSERRLVHHWYLGTRGLWDETVREFLALEFSPFARHTRGAVVRLSTPIDGGEMPADAEKPLAAMTALLEEPLAMLVEPRGASGTAK
ncbi:MAG TPA: EpsI family protein [Myxococcota bacterium]|nr:EpsI family protein [Myxococcota bacterium]